ncbi:MAG: Asp-tRNA(Asn)/Glu-tRNA(Gln) amidotransferase subunit GatA [Alphaproteobacteria bacterium]|nr:Asp-tRNA(Asn)/Glu-tRNA(Gln) amidotransferase subunit GatA [Alphaproteobacteria bacterium]
MKDLNSLSIIEALDGLKNKKFSSVELLTAHINALEKHKNLNIFITETLDLAKKKAAESDEKYANGSAGDLEGIPLAIKDAFCTKGIRTTNASQILHNFIPQYESTVTSKLFEAGSVMLGKANMDEFAMGSANTYSSFFPSINPWKETGSDETFSPGGSSGASAAAVAAKIAMGSTGTDTGGSVRQPAAFCGIVGFKPSYGRCSRYGIIAFASSLDQAGVFARSVEDAALLAKSTMGHDQKDSTSVNIGLPNLSEAMKKDVKGLRIGIPKEYRSEGLDPEIEKLWEDSVEMLKKEGAIIEEISLPHTKYGIGAYYVIAPAEASSNLSRFDGVRFGLREHEPGMTLDEMYTATRTKGFGHEVERRIMIGTYVLSSGYYEDYFLKAQKVRRLLVSDFDEAFKNIDAIITPTAPTAAFSIANKDKMDPVALYLNDLYTIPASMAGLPAISIPGRLNKKGLPLGIQIVGKRFDEETVFRAAKNLEKCFNFKESPKGF